MVNVKLGEEMRKDVIIMSRAWDEEKRIQTGIEPMTFRTPAEGSLTL